MVSFEILISNRRLLYRVCEENGQKIAITQEHDGYKSIRMSILSIFPLSQIK